MRPPSYLRREGLSGQGGVTSGIICHRPELSGAADLVCEVVGSLNVVFGAYFQAVLRRAYEAIATYGQNTSLRALCHLLQNCAAATSGDGTIRLPRIETTLRGMSCGSDALKLLHDR